MKLGSSTVWIVAVLASCSCAAQALAGDTGSPSTAKSSPLSSKVDQQINQAVGTGSGSSSDLDARIDDLEATRSAIDQKKPSSVSLSVSGWVSQQVQLNGKQ